MKACKNCSHYKWTEQLCHLKEDYYPDHFYCDDFDSIYNNSKTNIQETMKKLPQTVRDSPNP